LNNHHQDGKGQGAIKRALDVAAIRRAAAVDVLAVPVNFPRISAILDYFRQKNAKISQFIA
jgi:hypothetical protein